jgi:hypothetical protein
MSKLLSDAAMSGRGSRLGARFLGLVPLAAVLAACGGGGGGGSGGSSGGPLIVLAATPTNGQEILKDFSDPELNGKLTVKLSSVPRVSSIIDPTDPFNQLTPYVQILNQAFARVPGTPNVDKQTKSFTFTPAGGTLVNGQYTLTMAKFVTAADGSLLNSGVEDFSTSWTVGPDVYSPVIRNTSPAANQKDTPLFTPIVITFNESLDPASVVLGQTVFVQDGGTNPPTQLNGTLQLKRNGFDMVFFPDPCVGMPSSTTIVVRLLGAGNTSFVRDRVNPPNGLVGDPTNNNEYSFQFNTKGVKPLPTSINVPPSWSPRQNFNLYWNTVAYAYTNKATYAFDVTDVQEPPATSATATIDPSLTLQILQTNKTTQLPVTSTWWWYAPLQTFFRNGPYGGDWEAKLSKPGEAVVDWRFDGTTGVSYIYQIDEADESVAIINTGTGKVEGHFKGVGSPRGITITAPATTGNSVAILVTNYGQATLTAIPVSTIVPGQQICTAVKELEDNIKMRSFMSTGRNPAGVACEWYGTAQIGAVVNQADSTLQIFDPGSLKNVVSGALGTFTQPFPVGENPIDVCWTYLVTSPVHPPYIWAYVVNQGGQQDPQGSVSLWFNHSSLIGLFDSNTGIVVATLKDGVNVPGKPMSDPISLSCYIPNTAGDDIFKADINTAGNFTAVSVTLTTSQDRHLGSNPTKMTFTGNVNFMTALASLTGQGQVAVYQRDATVGPPILYPLPGVQSVFSAWDQ